MTDRKLIVKDVRAETPLIRRVVLQAPSGGPLPGFAAGAHITIAVPAVGARKYSLVNASSAPGATRAPQHYEIGVRLDAEGGGGSRFIHTLKVGDTLDVNGPDNAFALAGAPLPVLLIAGGIGVTPLVTMAAEMKAEARPFRFIYAARARGELAFQREIAALADRAAALHLDDEAGCVIDIAAILAGLEPTTSVYMCGPKPMLKAGIGAARRLGWPKDRLRFELFYSVVAAPATAAQPAAAPTTFEVELKSSGQVYPIPAGVSILDTLIAAGVDAVHDCKRGECGVCQVGVIAGVPDHRDAILSESERAGGKVMQICVSRSRSPRLVLDL